MSSRLLARLPPLEPLFTWLGLGLGSGFGFGFGFGLGLGLAPLGGLRTEALRRLSREVRTELAALMCSSMTLVW